MGIGLTEELCDETYKFALDRFLAEYDNDHRIICDAARDFLTLHKKDLDATRSIADDRWTEFLFSKETPHEFIAVVRPLNMTIVFTDGKVTAMNELVQVINESQVSLNDFFTMLSIDNAERVDPLTRFLNAVDAKFKRYEQLSRLINIRKASEAHISEHWK